MTQRKCGTCRFYEAGTQQSHGRCLNPANPQRDDSALLRPEETGCRSGWGVDFWVAREGLPTAPAVAGTPLLPDLHIDPRAPLPLAPAMAPIIPPLSARVGGADLAGAAPAGRRPGTQTAPAASAKSETIKAREILPALDPAMMNHPEIGENGVMLPKSRRSAVADAHKRALARREEERNQTLARERATLPERELPPVERAVPEERPLPPPVSTPVAPPAARLVPEPPKLTADDLKKPQFDLGVPTTPKFDFALKPPKEPEPAQATAPAPQPVAQAPAPAPIPEVAAEDIHISTDTPREPGVTERVGSLAPVERPPVRPADRPTDRSSEQTVERPAAAADRSALSSAETVPVISPDVTQPEGRYWDSPTNERFEKLRGFREALRNERDRAGRPGEPQRVKDIGRPPLPSTPPRQPERTIKPAQPTLTAAQAPTVPDPIQLEGAVETYRPAPQPPTVPVVPPRAELPRVELPPRVIDPALLKQLEGEWQAAALEAHAGQRCGGCRFFQAMDGGKGTCGCVFAPSHRRQFDGHDLGCLNPLGSWWAATDEGWLERTERRPRRATPLLDSLLRERERAVEDEELAVAGNERRRSVR